MHFPPPIRSLSYISMTRQVALEELGLSCAIGIFEIGTFGTSTSWHVKGKDESKITLKCRNQEALHKASFAVAHLVPTKTSEREIHVLRSIIVGIFFVKVGGVINSHKFTHWERGLWHMKVWLGTNVPIRKREYASFRGSKFLLTLKSRWGELTNDTYMMTCLSPQAARCCSLCTAVSTSGLGSESDSGIPTVDCLIGNFDMFLIYSISNGNPSPKKTTTHLEDDKSA